MKTYHKNIGFPETLAIPDVFVNLRYTRHALQRQHEDYKLKVAPKVVKIYSGNIVEAATEDGVTLKKVLIRTNYNKTHDMILVIEPDFTRNLGRVITLWINHKKDQHQTCTKQYDTP